MSSFAPDNVVLIVDDDEDIAEARCFALESAGYKCDRAGDGAHALAKLRSGQRPRVILLDMMMPNMNGQQFRVEQQRDPALAAIPVILLTGDGSAQRKAASLGLKQYLRKPVELVQLLAAVASAFRPASLTGTES